MVAVVVEVSCMISIIMTGSVEVVVSGSGSGAGSGAGSIIDSVEVASGSIIGSVEVVIGSGSGPSSGSTIGSVEVAVESVEVEPPVPPSQTPPSSADPSQSLSTPSQISSVGKTAPIHSPQTNCLP